MVAFNPYDPRAAFLLGMGGDMLKEAGWSTMPVSFGQALGAGLRGGRQSMMQAVQLKRLQDAQKIEEGVQRARMAKLRREAQAAEDLEALIAGLPPEQQRLARLNPTEFVKAQMGGGNLFAGTGLTAQAYNVYRNTAAKLREGEPISDQEWADYQLAYGEITKPEVRLVDGQEVMIRRNIPQLQRPGTAEVTPVAVSPEGQTPAEEPVGGSVVTRRRVEPKEWTAKQAETAGFADRMNHSAQVLDRLFSEGATYPSILESLQAVTGGLTRGAMSPQQQMIVDSAREFARASLRLESGAVISDKETMEQLRQYFPVPGDSAEAIANKKAQRDVLLEGLKKQSGGAYEALFGGDGDDSGGDTGGSGGNTARPQTEEAAAAGGQRQISPDTDITTLPDAVLMQLDINQLTEEQMQAYDAWMTSKGY